MRGITGRSGRLAVLGAVLAAALVTAGAPAVAAGGGAGGDEAIATLDVTAAKVEIRKAGADTFKQAKDGAKLREGDTVRTDATGQAEIQYGDDAYTRLDVDTTFTIDSLTDDQGNRQVKGTLESGKTWNRTVALTESESFEQTGADATAAVEGTAFTVECTSVDHCVFTAIVHDTTLTGDDGAVRLLTPLDQCDSTSGELCGDITKIPADQLPQWITDNLLRDLVERGIDDGPLTGIIVVDVAGTVVFRETPPSTPTSNPPAPTAPGAPTGVSASAGDGSATISFSPPASDGGSPITSYTAFASTGVLSTSVTAAAGTSGAGSPIVVTGLTNGETYTFTVVATNAVGTGPASAPSNTVTPATAPDAPAAVHTVVAGYAAAAVTVTPPLDDGGADVTSYTVTASGGGSCVAIAPATTCTVTSLSTGAHTFSATATNIAGTGPASSASNSVTPPIVVSGVASWLVAPSTPGVGWEATTYDDSGWTASTAPFQKTPVTACPSFPPGSSPFPLGSTLYLRHTFELPNGATGVVMLGTIDNYARIWINGQPVGSFSDGSCHANGISLSIPDAYLTGGENVVAVEAADDGSTAAYFSLEVTFAEPTASALTEPTPDEPVETTVEEPPTEPGA